MFMQEMKRQCDEKRFKMKKNLIWHTQKHMFFMLLILVYDSTEMYMNIWKLDKERRGGQGLERERVFQCSNCKWLVMNMMRRQHYLFSAWNLWNKDNLEVFLHRQLVTMQLRYFFKSHSSASFVFEINNHRAFFFLFMARKSYASSEGHISLLRLWIHMSNW